MLIHAYKFEDDPICKVEIILPSYTTPSPELPIQLMASMLECHEFLVPSSIAEPLAPYTKHEAKFLTVPEFLRANMPRNLYATQSLPTIRVPVTSGA